MPPSPAHRLTRTALALLAGLLAACTARVAPDDGRWSSAGEIVAMSGGSAGVRGACVSCHGARGEGNGFDAPRLAGLPAGYLQKQMEDYAAGLRPHAVMRNVARALDGDERVRVARYYAALPPQAMVPVASQAVDASTPALYARACQQCHGVDGAGGPHGPPLSGQPAHYLAQQLQDWQVSKRRNDGNHEMLKVAQQLEPAEVMALSQYLARSPARPGSAAR